MMLIIFVVLTIVLNGGMAAEECNEDSLKQCLNTLEQLLLNQFQGVKKAEKDFSSYCQTLENEGSCLKEASQSCSDKHPIISNLVSAFHAYLNQFCTDQGKQYMEMLPCFEHHKSEFEKCWVGGRSKRDDSLKDICKEIQSMQCVAELSKEICKSGESFGNSLLSYVKKLKADVCNRAGFIGVNYWTLVATVLLSLIIRIKH